MITLLLDIPQPRRGSELLVLIALVVIRDCGCSCARGGDRNLRFLPECNEAARRRARLAKDGRARNPVLSQNLRRTRRILKKPAGAKRLIDLR